MSVPLNPCSHSNYHCHWHSSRSNRLRSRRNTDDCPCHWNSWSCWEWLCPISCYWRCSPGCYCSHLECSWSDWYSCVPCAPELWNVHAYSQAQSGFWSKNSVPTTMERRLLRRRRCQIEVIEILRKQSVAHLQNASSQCFRPWSSWRI